MTRVLDKRLSKLLYAFRVTSPYFRGKARLFHWLRLLMGRPRMIIPYGSGGWITVDDEGEYIERRMICLTL